MGICRADHATPLYPQKLALNFVNKWWSLTKAGTKFCQQVVVAQSGIVRLQTKGHGVCLYDNTEIPNFA
jgi:hypothetical protein